MALACFVVGVGRVVVSVGSVTMYIAVDVDVVVVDIASVDCVNVGVVYAGCVVVVCVGVDGSVVVGCVTDFAVVVGIVIVSDAGSVVVSWSLVLVRLPIGVLSMFVSL